MVAVVGGAAVYGMLWEVGRRTPPESPEYPAFFGLAVCGVLLMSPHLLYYEAGLLVLPALLGIETVLSRGRSTSTGLRFFFAASFLAYPMWELSELIQFQPLILLLFAFFYWMARLVRTGPARTRKGEKSQGPSQAV
jgi:hypothetical protein